MSHSTSLEDDWAEDWNRLEKRVAMLECEVEDLKHHVAKQSETISRLTTEYNQHIANLSFEVRQLNNACTGLRAGLVAVAAIVDTKS